MNWQSAALHDVCRPKQWKTIAASKLHDSGYPVYGANGKIGFYDDYTHESPTLMITCRGATCGNVHISEPKSYINGNAMALDDLDTDRVDIKYLYYYFISRGFSDVISGSAQPQITGQGLTKVKIPLPPLKEQKRIAAILDKADNLRCKRQQAIQLADEFLRAVFLDMFGDPVTNPKGWETIELGDALESIDNGSSPKCDTRQADIGEWGVLKLGAVSSCQYKESENKAVFSDYTPNQNHEVKCGDLLFTRKNTYDLVAATALVETTQGKILLPDLIFRLNTKPTIEKHFLWKLLTHKGMRKKIQQLASGAAGSMPNISKANLRTVEIILPPKKLQKEFEIVCKKAIAQSKKHESHESLRKNLFSSISKDAFAGNL